MTRMHTRHRAGFTLIELLVVIGIIALLGALVASGVQRARLSQQAKSTEMTITKLQHGLDGQWKAVLDEVRSRQPSPIVLNNWADGDPDRAQALIAFATLRVQFPQSFQEACSGVNFGNGYVVPPLAVFASRIPVPLQSLPPTTDPELQAAALLYIILSEKSVRGYVFPADDTTNGAQMDVDIPSGSGNKFRVFRDSYGSPITFIRFAQNPELDSPSFSNLKTATKDPLDPIYVTGPLQKQGKLSNWLDPANASQQSPRKVLAQTLLGVAFNGSNRVITTISAGQNKQFEFNPLGLTDDVYGYRLARLGAKGE